MTFKHLNRIIFDENTNVGKVRNGTQTLTDLFPTNAVAIASGNYSNWTTIKTTQNINSPYNLNAAAPGLKNRMWYGHDFQFTGGTQAAGRGSNIFERCVTDNSKIYCFKYNFVHDANAGNIGTMELVTDFDNIEILIDVGAHKGESIQLFLDNML